MFHLILNKILMEKLRMEIVPLNIQKRFSVNMKVSWTNKKGDIFMSGKAEFVYFGSVNI